MVDITQNKVTPLAKVCRIIYGLLLLILGLWLTIWGYKLVALAGSSYYLITGIAIVVSSLLIMIGYAWGCWLYALMMAWTLVWAVAEVGIDFWNLLGRLAVLYALGLWMLTPLFTKALVHGPRSVRARYLATSGFVMVLVALTVIGFIKGDPSVIENTKPLPNAVAKVATTTNWPMFGNDQGGSRFSPLTQITPQNVSQLKVMWEYHTGDFPPKEGPNRRLETTPINIGDSLFLCSARNSIIALDAETGKQKWRFDPEPKVNLAGVTGSAACRGVAYYAIPNATGICAHRVYGSTVDARLIAVDAETGKACPTFGDKGYVDLKKGMGEVIPGYYYPSSAPVISHGKIVLGGWVSDGQMVGEPSGVIRAFDVVTGKLSWAYDVGRPNEHGEPTDGQIYTRGTPNSWGPMSADDELGLVYVPTGNSTPDYYGGYRRPIDDEISSSILALDIETGALRWKYQTVHHDLWDYDISGQPTLVDFPVAGKLIPALIQPTKRGEMFVLDRRTGEPLTQVEERAVPQSKVIGEHTAATQPFSVGMPSFSGIEPKEANMWGVGPVDQLWCRIKFKQARFDGTMTPPGLDASINYPGSLGGVDWGGVAVDPERKLMVVNSSNVPMYVNLIPRQEADKMGLEPSDGIHAAAVGGSVPQAGTPYAANLTPFLSPLGAPCNAPPYGMLSLVDLTSRQVLWSQRLGTAADSGLLGIHSRLPIAMGLPNIAGSLVTRSGLIFIAASQELNLNAVDLATGKTLWKGKLPAGGQASPMTYISTKSGKQFVVIAAGGHNLMETPNGDSIIAYALPDNVITQPHK